MAETTTLYFKATKRDKVAQVICNFALRRIATQEYCTLIDTAIRYGLAAAAVEVAQADP